MSLSCDTRLTYPAGSLRAMLPAAVLLLLLCACACSRERTVVYSDFVDIPSGGWPADEFCMFETAELDSALFVNNASRYDVILVVRHTGNCPYDRLFLPVSQSSAECPPLPDTLCVRLADASGTWAGGYSKGIYTVADTLLRNVSLPPLYSLKVGQAMPGHALPGLLGMGLVIQQHKP